MGLKSGRDNLPVAVYRLCGLAARQIAPITAKFNKSSLYGKNSIQFCIDEEKESSNQNGRARSKFMVIKGQVHLFKV